MNIFTLLDQAAKRFPDQGAVYIGDKLVHSYGTLRSRALSVAAALRQSYSRLTRVAVMSENRCEYVEILFGIWAAEMVAVPVNAKLHAREAAQIIEDSGALMVLVSPKLEEPLAQAVAEIPAISCYLIVIGGSAYEALFAEIAEAPARTRPETLAWLFYTSGTTGRSKGAMLSHRNILAMTIQHLADVETLNEKCSIIHAAPMSHGSGLYLPAYVARAARLIVPASSVFDPAEFLSLCDFHPGCGAFLAPTMVQRLRLEAERSGKRPANLRSIIYGGGPMYVEELKRSLAVFGRVFVQIYGQGESPMTITCLRREDHDLDDEAILGSVGWARTCVEVAVVDGDGRPLANGEVGEIVCRGDVVMSGYWNNSDATANTLRDGWLYTGDVGSFDDRGYLTLRDRSKDVIISGGTNIYPREVEEALLRHPGIAETSVIGQPDPEWGEIVVAFVVRVPEANVTEDVLDAHCLSHIARFKRPKRYVFVETLPKNNYGKVMKRELRDRLAE